MVGEGEASQRYWTTGNDHLRKMWLRMSFLDGVGGRIQSLSFKFEVKWFLCRNLISHIKHFKSTSNFCKHCPDLFYLWADTVKLSLVAQQGYLDNLVEKGREKHFSGVCVRVCLNADAGFVGRREESQCKTTRGEKQGAPMWERHLPVSRVRCSPMEGSSDVRLPPPSNWVSL